MRKILPALLGPLLLLASCGPKAPEEKACFHWDVPAPAFDFARYVDPMIGTGGHGHTFPGATAPFGMVQLSPDTRVDDSWDGCSGYHYSDSLIYGFSHTHLSGTGCSDYGDVLLMPGVNRSFFGGNYDLKPDYFSHFSHANEKAEAGYYSVLLDKSQVKAELTASPRTGVHRYTFPKGKEHWITIDLRHRDKVIDSKLEYVDDHTLKGYRESKAWANDQKLWFYIEFSQPFTALTLGEKTTSVIEGERCAESLQFEADTVIVKVSISAVSCENAKLNMQTEVPGFDFDAVRKKCVQQWNNELGKIEVQNCSDEDELKIFYTALYHCFVAPNLYCDVNGDYRGMDQQVHRDTIHPQYSVFSLWDTYRALHPLFTIIQPERDQDFINTFLKQYKEGGRLPVWELSANETDCMIGYHSVPVIVDAWMKGLTDFDTALAYEAMKHSAMLDDRGLQAYKKSGFIPAEGESESVSKTLEYAYDDWCIALAAKRMKNDADYNYFMHRSQSWKNLYDPKTGFMRARLNNSFVEPFDPNEVNFHYTEANAWQYSLAVQQDVRGLIAAHGGDKNFITFLDQLFTASSQTSGRDQADISGLIGQYAQGNEPSHHMAYLYDFTSQPWKTQELVSQICNNQYKTGPEGLCGNEDCGQMSAWYVMSMIGIYDVSPGSGMFSIGSPRFSTVVLHLDNKHSFTFRDYLPAEASTTNPLQSYCYVKSFELNNTALRRPELSYAALMKGGSLTTTLALGPKDCGTFDLPDTAGSAAKKMPLVPRVVATIIPEGKERSVKRTFISEMHVRMQSEGSVEIFASINGQNFQSVPFLSFSGGQAAFTGYDLFISETSTIRAFARDAQRNTSDTVTFSFTKIPGGRSIQLLTKYQNQYAAGGDNALIDGLRGPSNFRTGSWQGYEGNDLEAVVDLGSRKEITKVTTGFLQDQGAWIFMPEEVMVYFSDDGISWQEFGQSKNTIVQTEDGAILHDFAVTNTVQARYIKVKAKNPGVCPEWHPGKGKPCWIFADEILIDAR